MNSQDALLCIMQGYWWVKILKANTTENIKLLAAKKTTYIEVNTPCTNQICNSFERLSTRVSLVTQKLSQEQNAKSVRLKPVMIILD